MDSGLYSKVFRYPARATEPVALVGSFNHWDPRAHPLRLTDGEWKLTVYLPAGTYPYAFVSRGHLIRDPDSRRSPVGARYSILTVGEGRTRQPGRETSASTQRRFPRRRRRLWGRGSKQVS